MKRFFVLATLCLASFGAHAATMADYASRIKGLSTEIEPDRRAEPLFQAPGFAAPLQQYYHRISKETDNLTIRDYRRLRAGYQRAYGLALEAASDDDLTQDQKFAVLESLTDTVGGSIEKLTEPYVDAQLPENITRENGENVVAFAGRVVWSKLVYAAHFTSRDFTTWVNPGDGRGNAAWRNIPRNAIASWGNIKRSYFLKKTAKDLSKLYNAELKDAKRSNEYNAKLAALVNLVQEFHELKIEPVRFGRAHKWVGRFYLFMGFGYWYLLPYHDIVADLPPYWGERTKLTGIMSVALGAAAWSTLYATRRGNSGVGFYHRVGKLMAKNERVLEKLPLSGDQKALCERLLKTTAETL